MADLMGIDVAKSTCSVATCERPVRCKELCGPHYSSHLAKIRSAAKPTVYGDCQHCGEKFAQTRGRRPRAFCTSLCKSQFEAAAAKAARQAARECTECDWCGVDIRHMRADAKFCSDVCSNRCDLRDNRERVVAAAKRYVEQNPEKVLAASRRYREANRHRIYDRQKRWQAENLEHHRNYQREYGRRYVLENADKVRLQHANRYASKRSNGGGALKISDYDWSRMLAIYDHRCAYCGSDGYGETLHMDHVVPLARGGRHAIGNVVPACPSCNYSKNDRLVTEWRYGFYSRRVRRSMAVTTM